MRKSFLGLIALGLVAGAVTFYSCQKDKMLQNERNTQQVLSSTGNYSQSTQSIAIQTHINIGATTYPITGNATAGNYNGQIYGCNLMWTMHFGTKVVSFHLDATLRPEFEDLATIVEPTMEHYIITINQQPISADGYTFEVTAGEVITIPYHSIVELWGRVVEICDADVVSNLPKIIEAHNLMVDFIYRSKQALDRNPTKFEAICAADDMQGLINMIFTDYEATQWGIRFIGLVEEISTASPTNNSSTGTDYCSSCALKDFPEALRNFNYDPPMMAPQVNWIDLLMCFDLCLTGCVNSPACWFVPALCGGCVAICTAACYGVSQAVSMAPYSCENQAYIEYQPIAY